MYYCYCLFICISDGLTPIKRGFLILMASLVICVALIRLLLESFQLITLKIAYILNWVNWIELILFPCAILFVAVYRTPCLCPAGWQWQVGCIAVFLTWIDLIVFIQKLPFVGKNHTYCIPSIVWPYLRPLSGS